MVQRRLMSGIREVRVQESTYLIILSLSLVGIAPSKTRQTLRRGTFRPPVAEEDKRCTWLALKGQIYIPDISKVLCDRSSANADASTDRRSVSQKPIYDYYLVLQVVQSGVAIPSLPKKKIEKKADNCMSDAIPPNSGNTCPNFCASLHMLTRLTPLECQQGPS
jgi:hypothetical protein